MSDKEKTGDKLVEEFLDRFSPDIKALNEFESYVSNLFAETRALYDKIEKPKNSP